MSKDKVYRFRLTDDQRDLLQQEAAERGLTKADRIRQALGWPLADRPVQPTPSQTFVPPTRPVDPDRQPGLAAIDQIAKRMGGRS